MSQANIKQIIKKEYLKCAKEPQYFMKKYCVVQHPMRGKVPFHLYPFQEKCLDVFEDDKYCIVLKSRQLGLSTLSAGYALWLMPFHSDKKILVLNCVAIFNYRYHFIKKIIIKNIIITNSPH